MGMHLLKSWSATQKNITLSSAEAELVAAVKTCSEALGALQLAYDWGIQLNAKVFVDSSAAIGVASRKGNGKMRHVRVGDLWIQELVEEEEISLRKIAGTSNIADAFTKHLPQKTMNEHLERMRLELRQGRAASGLHVQRDAEQGEPRGEVWGVRESVEERRARGGTPPLESSSPLAFGVRGRRARGRRSRRRTPCRRCT